MRTVKQLLEDAGVQDVHYFSDRYPGVVEERKGSLHGTLPAEPYDTGKDHFVPKFRDVHVSSPMRNGRNADGSKHPVFYYVTSAIHGEMRRYRCRHSYETCVGNIFASGATKREAVLKWIERFRRLEYNRGQYGGDIGTVLSS